MEKPIIFMMVGLPGSGKSYQAKLLSEQYKASIHSSDSIREELYGDPRIQDNHELVFRTLHQRVKEDLHNNKNTIYDATNINYKRRKAFLQELSKTECWKVCVFVATPYKVCLERNKSRNAVVPEDVIKNMLEHFWVPQNYEGWDDIVIVKDFDTSDYNIRDLFNYGSPDYSNGINSIEQDNPHHTLTVGHHCLLTKTIMEQNYPDFRDEIYMAAMLHDIGKPFTKSPVDIEEWRSVEGYEDVYEVSSFGRVRNIISGKLLSLSRHSGGYLNVHLQGKTIYVHRLVANAFCKDSNVHDCLGLDVNHLDYNKENNFYKNLEWCTRSNNQIHAFVTQQNRNVSGYDKWNAKLTRDDVAKIKNIKGSQKISNTALGKMFRVDRSCISRIINGVKYKDTNSVFNEKMVVEPILPITVSHYYQHHLVGAYMSLFYTPATYTDTQRLQVANVIQHHMRPFEIEKSPHANKINEKFKELVGIDDYTAIMALHFSDIKAK
jgi:predicted kinase